MNKIIFYRFLKEYHLFHEYMLCGLHNNVDFLFKLSSRLESDNIELCKYIIDNSFNWSIANEYINSETDWSTYNAMFNSLISMIRKSKL